MNLDHFVIKSPRPPLAQVVKSAQMADLRAKLDEIGEVPDFHRSVQWLADQDRLTPRSARQLLADSMRRVEELIDSARGAHVLRFDTVGAFRADAERLRKDAKTAADESVKAMEKGVELAQTTLPEFASDAKQSIDWLKRYVREGLEEVDRSKESAFVHQPS